MRLPIVWQICGALTLSLPLSACKAMQHLQCLLRRVGSAAGSAVPQVLTAGNWNSGTRLPYCSMATPPPCPSTSNSLTSTIPPPVRPTGVRVPAAAARSIKDLA